MPERQSFADEVTASQERERARQRQFLWTQPRVLPPGVRGITPQTLVGSQPVTSAPSDLPTPSFGGQDVGGAGMISGLGAQPRTRASMAFDPQRAAPTTPSPMVFNGPNPSQAPPVPVGGGPIIYNGGDLARPAGIPGNGSPVRDDVVRALGGRDGQVPSMNQFLAALPQVMTMQFGVGSGQLGNPLGIGPHGGAGTGYTPAFQGAEQRSDHTAAGMTAFNALLGQYTTGPDSPSQAMHRTNDAAVRTLEAISKYQPRTGLAFREQDRLDRDTHPDRDWSRFVAGQLGQGVDRNTIAEDVAFGRSLQPGAAGAANTTPPGNAGATPSVSGATPPIDPQQAALSRIFREAVGRHVTQPVPTAGGRPLQPHIGPDAKPEQINAALTRFISSLPPNVIDAPGAGPRLRQFITNATNFGEPEFQRWLAQRAPMFGSTPETEATQAAIRRARAIMGIR